MKIRILIVSLVVTIFSLLYILDRLSYFTQWSPWAQLDLPRVCRDSQIIVSTQSDASSHVHLFNTKIQNDIFYSPSTKNLMKVLILADSNIRPELIKIYLSEIGAKKFDCTSFDQIFNQNFTY